MKSPPPAPTKPRSPYILTSPLARTRNGLALRAGKFRDFKRERKFVETFGGGYVLDHRHFATNVTTSASPINDANSATTSTVMSNATTEISIPLNDTAGTPLNNAAAVSLNDVAPATARMTSNATAATSTPFTNSTAITGNPLNDMSATLEANAIMTPSTLKDTANMSFCLPTPPSPRVRVIGYSNPPSPSPCLPAMRDAALISIMAQSADDDRTFFNTQEPSQDSGMRMYALTPSEWRVIQSIRAASIATTAELEGQLAVVRAECEQLRSDQERVVDFLNGIYMN